MILVLTSQNDDDTRERCRRETKLGSENPKKRQRRLSHLLVGPSAHVRSSPKLSRLFFTLHGDIPQMISGGLISAGEGIKRMEYRHAGILKRKPRKKRVAFGLAGSVF